MTPGQSLYWKIKVRSRILKMRFGRKTTGVKDIKVMVFWNGHLEYFHFSSFEISPSLKFNFSVSEWKKFLHFPRYHFKNLRFMSWKKTFILSLELNSPLPPHSKKDATISLLLAAPHSICLFQQQSSSNRTNVIQEIIPVSIVNCVPFWLWPYHCTQLYFLTAYCDGLRSDSGQFHWLF